MIARLEVCAEADIDAPVTFGPPAPQALDGAAQTEIVAEHFKEGIYPGGVGRFFTEHGVHGTRGLPEFWTLYYGMTGLHAIHVTIGSGVLGAMIVGMLVLLTLTITGVIGTK